MNFKSNFLKLYIYSFIYIPTYIRYMIYYVEFVVFPERSPLIIKFTFFKKLWHAGHWWLVLVILANLGG